MASTSIVEVDPENELLERDIEIGKLMKCIDIILSMLGAEKSATLNSDIRSGIIDIDISNEISEVLMTVYTCLRKEQNDPTGFTRYKAYTATIQGVDIAISSVVDEIKKDKIELNFLIATPIVELMTLFKSCFNEVRTGMTRFKVRENEAKIAVKRDSSGKAIGRQDKSRESKQNISQYGLNMHHVPLLQGITFAPERRTGVIQSLGPLTQALMLVIEDKYDNTLQSALMNSLQMLPMAAEITNCLKEERKPSDVAWILKELGDLLTLTTARSTQKYYFPLTLYYYMRKIKPQSLSWSFSGNSMIKAYTELIIKGGLRFKIKSRSDKDKTAQIVFHAMFGTYLDDLEICEQITEGTGRWFQRKDVNEVFLKRGDAPTLEFVPIKFKYIKKMAQALLTKSLGNVNSVCTSRPAFSGFRKRAFSQEFLNYLGTGKNRQTTLSFSSEPIQLLYALRKTKDHVMKDIETVKLLKAGTTTWETFVNGGWVTCDFEAVEGSRKFFGF